MQTEVTAQDHCWHADPDSPESYDPWPARTGRQGVRCCSCPAIGWRPITLAESKYEGFHTFELPLFGHVTQTHGAATCSGADLRDEKYTTWMANAVGYVALVAVVILAGLFLPPTIAQILSASQFLWVIALWIFGYVVYGFLRHGHGELARIRAALAKNRAAPPVRVVKESTYGAGQLAEPRSRLHDSAPVTLPEAPRFIAACPECQKAEAVLDSSRHMMAWREADRWVYTGVVCCGCGRSFSMHAIDNPDGGLPSIEAGWGLGWLTKPSATSGGIDGMDVP